MELTGCAFQWPDLLLHVEASSRPQDRARLAFRGVSNGTEARDFGHVEISNPAPIINRLGGILDEWADPQRSGELESLSAHLEGIGIRFFRDLIPPALQDHYWSHLHSAPGKTVLLVAEGAAAVILPWEIIKPVRDKAEAPFWCEHFALSRWLPDYPIAQSLPERPVACVIADPGLRDVAEPALGLLNPESVIYDWKDLNILLRSEGIGIFHWTGHGEPDPDNPSFSKLPIGREAFRPVNVLSPEQRRFLSTQPLVFLHACSTTHIAGALIGLGGWPNDLIDGGAGAVLGTAWDVRTSTAIPFVQHFYESILNGKSVGAAVREARSAARTAGDPSWLAYQLYAHPGASVLTHSRAGQRTGNPVKLIIQHAFRETDQEDVTWRHSYLQWIKDHFLFDREYCVPLAGAAKRGEELEYSTIYVEPSTYGDRIVDHSFTNIVDAIQEYKAVVLLGYSGSGKTATLRRIMLKLAGTALNGESRVPTPILVSLDEYGLEDHPLDYIQERCEETIRSRIKTELEKKRVCLLCDGLNEMSRKDYARKIRAWRNFVARYPGNQFVFACRRSWYQDELHLQKIEISPLDDERIVRSLFMAVGEGADGLWASIKNAGLVDICRMPLLLQWLLQSYRSSGNRLPRNLSRVLKGLFDTLVQREEETGAYKCLALDEVTRAMGELAHEMRTGNFEGAIPHKRAEIILNNFAPHDCEAAQFVPEVLGFTLASGILNEKNAQLRFRDSQFRDYLTGVALAARFAEGENLAPYCRPSARIPATPSSDTGAWQALPPPADSEWVDALVMASGLVADTASFLRAVCDVDARVAGECLLRNTTTVESHTIDTIRAGLLHAATDATKPLTERATAATILGKIGDPRFKEIQGAAGVSYLAPDLVSVPSGTVWMGSDSQDDMAFADEHPQHQVSVPAILIGRYPVTNAEFARFVASGGYNESSYWTEAGWLWRQARDTGEGSTTRSLRNLAYFRMHSKDLEHWLEEAKLPESEREMWRSLLRLEDSDARERLRELGIWMVRSKDSPPYLQDPRYGGNNQPVVGVTWYEAMAYCSWLSSISGKLFVLPTEVQWERAAKGERTWAYPWGPSWESDRCNNLSERLLTSSPVGIFPAGRSPFGCEDMVGNVFEWTKSIYRPYPYDPSDGREEITGNEVRVNRGGGWDSVARITRCALRGDMCEPQSYDRNVGFRVATLA